MDITKRINRRKRKKRWTNSKEKIIANEREDISIGVLITGGMQGKSVLKRIERKINRKTWRIRKKEKERINSTGKYTAYPRGEISMEETLKRSNRHLGVDNNWNAWKKCLKKESKGK